MASVWELRRHVRNIRSCCLTAVSRLYIMCSVLFRQMQDSTK